MKRNIFLETILEKAANDRTTHHVWLAIREVCDEAEILSEDLRMMTLVTERLFTK